MALIVFDIDGTLFRTDLVTVPAVQRTFAAYGLPEPDAAKIVSFFGRPNETYLDWLATLCSPAMAPKIIGAVNRLELDLVRTEGRLYPGVIEMFDTLKTDGYRMALYSNGPEDYVAAFLDAHGVAPFIDIVRTRGERSDGKRVLLREIIDLTGPRGPGPTACVVVGDRDDDIRAAHANRAFAIGTCYGFGAPDELMEADARVQSVAEIPEAIRRLIAKGS